MNFALQQVTSVLLSIAYNRTLLINLRISTRRNRFKIKCKNRFKITCKYNASKRIKKQQHSKKYKTFSQKDFLKLISKKKRKSRSRNFRNINEAARIESPNKPHKHPGSSDSTKIRSKPSKVELMPSAEPLIPSQTNQKTNGNHMKKQ